ncbi:MAG: carboxylating nicotinate-nucleotide diphosphorylase [Planctomycetota bacterium]
MNNMKKSDNEKIRALIRLAVDEDLGKGDLTSQITLKPGITAKADIITREEIVVCGMDVVREVLNLYDKKLKLRILIGDSKRANVAGRLGTIEGPLASMLTAERVVLNFLQRLSGIATLTRKYVNAIRGTKAKIYDTRKTTPGWRELEKYAVRCGGGYNHRMRLDDGILIKDNHIAELGRNFYPKLRRIIEKAKSFKGLKFVAVEVDHVDDQLDHVLKIPGIDVILLDNMGQWQLKHAVEIRNKICGKKPLLEASGNITLNNVTAVAQCGVDRIAVGALTHSAIAVDIGLDRPDA